MVPGVHLRRDGITPAYQVMKKALKDPTDRTTLYLANQTPADILLREDLNGWAEQATVP